MALNDLPGQGLKLRLQVAVVVHDEVGVGREVRIELPLENQMDSSFKNNFFTQSELTEPVSPKAAQFIYLFYYFLTQLELHLLLPW